MAQLISRSTFNDIACDAEDLGAQALFSKQEKLFAADPLEVYRSKRRAEQDKAIVSITVDAKSMCKLRSIVVCTCGDLVTYIRVKPLDHASKMKVWLCLSQSSVDAVMSNIMHVLPEAELGRITPMLSV